MKLISLSILMFLCSCTDAWKAKITAIGSSHSISCYSGSRLIYEGESTGKVNNETNSDGYYFNDKKTNELVTVSGNCITRAL